MRQILSIIMNINYIYLLLAIISFNALFIFLYRNKKKKLIPIITIVYLLIFLLSYNYFDSLFNSVLTLNYSSTRSYLVVLIVINIIALITVNYKINIFNKILNYLLFILSVIILILNVLLLLNNEINLINISILIMIYTIDINIIIFVGYLYITLLSYIIREVIKEIVQIRNKANDIKNYDNVYENKEVLTSDNIDFNLSNDINVLKEQALYNSIPDTKKFVIDGKDCSFIFDDPNKDNVIKNYYILLTDVNARLVNGYTVDENIKINNILNRLNVKNINNLNLMSMEVLSKLDDNEYILLKNLLDNYNKSL